MQVEKALLRRLEGSQACVRLTACGVALESRQVRREKLPRHPVQEEPQEGAALEWLGRRHREMQVGFIRLVSTR